MTFFSGLIFLSYVRMRVHTRAEKACKDTKNF